MPFPETGSAFNDIREQMHRVAKVFASPTGSLIRHLVATSQGDREVSDLFRERFFDHRRALAKICIKKGIDSGELRRDLDIEAVVDALYAPLWLRLIMDHQPLSTEAADGILDLVWPGLVAPD